MFVANALVRLFILGAGVMSWRPDDHNGTDFRQAAMMPKLAQHRHYDAL